ncbi:MAG: aldehyde dehydrogenase family protein, partial [Acidimicrobiales bacterium]
PQAPWLTNSLGGVVESLTDIPPGVVNVLSSGSSDVGEILVTDPMVDMVSFTGSTQTGRRVMAAASETVKKVFLELGGKSAFIMLDDADLELASLVAGFTVCSHAGQGCAITTRLLVPESKYADAIDLLSDVVKKVPVGDPRDPSMMMGPLISASQHERVNGYVTGAVAQGARIATGGGRPEHLPTGYFFEPTVLVDVDPNSVVAREEIFGPVLVVLPFKDDDDAVDIANNSIFGLSGAVHSSDLERATGVARRLRTGTVSINGGVYYGPDAPFGGFKQSGVGREMGVAGFEEYLELKTLATPAA